MRLAGSQNVQGLIVWIFHTGTLPTGVQSGCFVVHTHVGQLRCWTHIRRRDSGIVFVGGSGGMLPQKFFKLALQIEAFDSIQSIIYCIFLVQTDALHGPIFFQFLTQLFSHFLQFLPFPDLHETVGRDLQSIHSGALSGKGKAGTEQTEGPQAEIQKS